MPYIEKYYLRTATCVHAAILFSACTRGPRNDVVLSGTCRSIDLQFNHIAEISPHVCEAADVAIKRQLTQGPGHMLPDQPDRFALTN